MTETSRQSEITLPSEVLTALHRAASDRHEGDADAILREAGASLGRSVLETLAGAGSDDPSSASADDFWGDLRDYLSSRGWGTISHERIHPGLGRLRAVDWAEAGDGGGPLSTGILSGLFTALVGQPIDVIHTPGSEDEPDAAFVFGSPDAVGGLRRLLDEGIDLPAALVRL